MGLQMRSVVEVPAARRCQGSGSVRMYAVVTGIAVWSRNGSVMVCAGAVTTGAPVSTGGLV